jgi:hypothetical protein
MTSKGEAMHTGLPWRVARRYGSINGALIVGGGQTIIASITRRADKPICQKEADASLIVTACNAYPDLLRRVSEGADKIDLAEGAAMLLVQAINSEDPKAELMLRARDLVQDLKAARSALTQSAQSDEGQL